MNKIRVYQTGLSNLVSAHVSRRLLTIKPADIGLVLLGTAVSYGTYKIVKIYLTRRKYRHIPGPSTPGFF